MILAYSEIHPWVSYLDGGHRLLDSEVRGVQHFSHLQAANALCQCVGHINPFFHDYPVSNHSREEVNILSCDSNGAASSLSECRGTASTAVRPRKHEILRVCKKLATAHQVMFQMRLRSVVTALTRGVQGEGGA